MNHFSLDIIKNENHVVFPLSIYEKKCHCKACVKCIKAEDIT